MMDPLTRRVQPVKRRSRRKPLSVEIQSAYQMLMVLLVVIGGSSMALFLYTNSLKPAKGYMLKELQIHHEALSSESRKLEHKMIEAQSIVNLEEEEIVENMHEMSHDEFSYAETDHGYAYNE